MQWINRSVEQIAVEAELHRPVLPLVAVSRKPPSLFSATGSGYGPDGSRLGESFTTVTEKTVMQCGLITSPATSPSPQIWPFPVNPNTLVQRSGRYRRTRAEVVCITVIAVGILEIEHMPRLYELVVPLRVRSSRFSEAVLRAIPR